MAAVAAVLLRVVTATGRLLIEAGYWSELALAPSALMASGDMAWPGWDSGAGPG